MDLVGVSLMEIDGVVSSSGKLMVGIEGSSGRLIVGIDGPGASSKVI